LGMWREKILGLKHTHSELLGQIFESHQLPDPQRHGSNFLPAGSGCLCGLVASWNPKRSQTYCKHMFSAHRTTQSKLMLKTTLK
jgi:hypothetical protein